MKVSLVSIAKVVPYERNPRKNDGAVAKVAASLSEFGWQQPIVVDSEMVIIAGHTRYKAALELGMDKVPVVIAAGLSPEQVKAYRLADNRTGEEAEWDLGLLKLELGDLDMAGYSLALTGFSDEELEELVLDGVDESGLTDDDAVPPVEERAVSGYGDVWILGDHRVMCGDSTALEDVEKLCAGAPIDCCWTDPPYNVNYESGSGQKIKNDHMAAAAFRQFLLSAFSAAYGVLREGAPIYVAHADTEGLNFRGAFTEAGFKLSGCVIWVKNALVLGRSDYQWRHEPILYGWKPGAAHSWYGGRAKTTVAEAAGDLPFVVEADGGAVQIETGAGTLRISGQNLQVEELLGTVVRAEKPKRSAEHPTMKPVDLVLGHIKNSSKRGDSVLDLFGGSGSTLIACHKTARRSRLMEFDPKYCDVIVRRWQDFSGKIATLEGSGETFTQVAVRRAGEDAREAAE